MTESKEYFTILDTECGEIQTDLSHDEALIFLRECFRDYPDCEIMSESVKVYRQRGDDLILVRYALSSKPTFKLIE